MIGVGIAAAIGGIALAGASYAERGLGGMGFFAMGQFGLVAMEIFESIDTDGDGKLSQTEIDKVRNDRHLRPTMATATATSASMNSPASGMRPLVR